MKKFLKLARKIWHNDLLGIPVTLKAEAGGLPI